jgi:hypothetical protein
MTKLDWEKTNRAQMPKATKPKSQAQKRQEAVSKAYNNGTVRERERIIKLIRRVVSEHHSRKIQNVPSLLLIQLIEEGEQK